MKRVLLLCSALLLLTYSAKAQNFAIDWFTIDGGVGTSTGGVYALSGTIGQPDAGKLVGGNYLLDGGFWGIVLAIQTPGAPFLSIVRSNASVIVFWPAPAPGFVLDETTTLTGAPAPWMEVGFPYQTNATHISITAPASTGNKFYRLRKP
jgi:hypothetical protein